MFPSRRDDGSAEVAAVFGVPQELARNDVQQALDEWRQILGAVDIFKDLAGAPRIVWSVEGFRVVFAIKPGSRMWKDWAVALVSQISRRLGEESFLGFFDVVAGRMHPGSRRES